LSVAAEAASSMLLHQCSTCRPLAAGNTMNHEWSSGVADLYRISAQQHGRAFLQDACSGRHLGCCCCRCCAFILLQQSWR
jgi:hypothetical protein